MTDDESSSYTTYLHGRDGERVEVREDMDDVASVLAAAEQLDDPDETGGAAESVDVGWVTGVRAVVTAAVASLVSMLRR